MFICNRRWLSQDLSAASNILQMWFCSHCTDTCICFILSISVCRSVDKREEKIENKWALTFRLQSHFSTHWTAINWFSIWICLDCNSSWSIGSIELWSHKSYFVSMKLNGSPVFNGHSISTCANTHQMRAQREEKKKKDGEWLMEYLAALYLYFCSAFYLDSLIKFCLTSERT